MKKYINIILLGLALLFGRAGIIAAQVINLEGDVWAPYVMAPEQKNKGFIVDIATIIFERAGYTLNFKVVPWSRTLIDVENGRADGAVGIYFSQAYKEKFIVPKEHLGVSINKLFVKQESTWHFSGIESLSKMTLGVIADYDYGDLNDYIIGLKENNSPFIAVMSGNEALEKNLRKLISGRIDVLIDDALVVNFFAQQLDITSKIKIAGSINPINKIGIAFSPKRKQAEVWANILSSGIIKLRKSGELQIVLSRYNITDWVKN